MDRRAGLGLVEITRSVLCRLMLAYLLDIQVEMWNKHCSYPELRTSYEIKTAMKV